MSWTSKLQGNKLLWPVPKSRDANIQRRKSKVLINLSGVFRGPDMLLKLLLFYRSKETNCHLTTGESTRNDPGSSAGPGTDEE